MAQTVYALFVDEKLIGCCASFEIASELAQDHVVTKLPMRIESATHPSHLRVWSYNYVDQTWVERK